MLIKQNYNTNNLYFQFNKHNMVISHIKKIEIILKLKIKLISIILRFYLVSG